MHVTAIIAAAGAGSRLGGSVPKQFLELGGVPVWLRAVQAFQAAPRITDVIVVTRADAVAQVAALVTSSAKPTRVIEGGATRQASVARGVSALPKAAGYVLVHDAARPFVSPAIIERALDGAIEDGAAIVALPATDTVKRVRIDGGSAHIVETIPARASTWRRRRRPSAARCWRLRWRSGAAASTVPTKQRSPNGPVTRSASSRATRRM
jgi:2-C-methyl-D-erythritol 4-phosphate cytidylyltransferase